MEGLMPQAGPHMNVPDRVPSIMKMVIIALLPATLLGIWQFGWPAFNVVFVSLISAIVFESLCLRIRRQSQSLFLSDGSALLTGLLVALTLPPWAPWWIALCGSGFAIIVGKHVFGGIGQNIFNPAMLARVALLISFPVEMTSWVAPLPIYSIDAPSFYESLAITFNTTSQSWDAITGATILDHVKTGLSLDRTVPEIMSDGDYFWSSMTGLESGSLGETSALLIFLGGIWLMVRKIISWQAPVAMIGTVGIMAGISNMAAPESFMGIWEHLLSGGLMLGAFFIITDPVTSPTSPRGLLLFGFGCGFITFIIRTWGMFPEGVAFAVLIMNSMTPLIDYYVRPRRYGYNRAGEPLEVKKSKLS